MKVGNRPLQLWSFVIICYLLCDYAEGMVRLVNGATVNGLEGRVEIFYNNTWGTICDDEWDIEDANVVCKQLGYSEAIRPSSSAQYGQGTGPIWLDDVFCEGDEENLAQCVHRGWGVHNCDHSEDAGVVCIDYTAGMVRLVNGTTANEVEGRVEIFYNNTWGTICDDGWDLRDANVVCKQLGYSEAIRPSSSAEYGQGTGPIWLDDVDCEGDEESLAQCVHRGWGVHYCGHHDDAGVVCTEYIGEGMVRLVNGTTANELEGRVEIFHKNKWGTICDDGWDIDNANVVCKQLGYSEAIRPSSSAEYGQGTGPIWFVSTYCRGYEENLAQCFRSISKIDYCAPGIAGVVCTTGSPACDLHLVTYGKFKNTEYQVCGRQVTCSDISSHSGPGCYCKSGFRLDPSSGDCIRNSQCSSIHNSSSVLEPKLKLYAPSSTTLNGLSQEHVISWITLNSMISYNYTITSQEMVIASGILPSNVPDEKSFYRVQGNIGQLTLPDEVSTVEGDYSVEVTSELLYDEVTFTVQDAVRLDCTFGSSLRKEYSTTSGTWKLIQKKWLLRPPPQKLCEAWHTLEYVDGHWWQRSNGTCSPDADSCEVHLDTTTRTECHNGIPTFTYWRIESSNCWCNTSQSHPTTLETILSYAVICKKGYRNDIYGELTNTDYQVCGRQVTCFDISSHSGPGCYCKSGFRLDRSSGGCLNTTQCSSILNSSPVTVLQSKLKLYAPSSTTLNGLSQEHVISWITLNSMTSYNYTITSQDMVIASGIILPSNVPDEKSFYRVQGNIGQLTLPDEISTVKGDYSVEVTSELLYDEVTFTVQNAEPSNFDLRLAHGIPPVNHSVINGAVEVYYKYNAAWYLMCVPHWSKKATRVVCRQLGAGIEGSGSGADFKRSGADIEVDGSEAAGIGSFALSATSVYANMDTVPRWGMTMDVDNLQPCSGYEYRLDDCATILLHWHLYACNEDPARILQIQCANDL